MANTLTISAPSGRIWPKKPDLSPEGLFLSIDFSPSSSTPASATSFYATSSETLYTSDTRGNATQFLLSQNRYLQPVRKSPQVSKLLITPENDYLLLALKPKGLEIYSMNGKKFGSFFDHKFEIKGFDINHIRKSILSYSSDAVVIWDMNNWRKIRTMYARSNSYSMVKFSPDGQSIITCFREGTIFQWSLSTNDLEKQFAMSSIDIFDFNQGILYGVGKDLSIKVWRLDSPQKLEYSFGPIPGVKDFSKMQCYKRHVVLSADNGRLYFIDPVECKIEFEFQIGTLFIVDFQIIHDKLFLILSNGTVNAYDFSTLLNKCTSIANKRLSMGLEENLVYTHLPKSTFNETFIHPNLDSNPPLNPKEDVLFTKIGTNMSILSTPTGSSSVSDTLQCQHELFINLFKQAKLDPHDCKIQHCQLRRILHYYGEYPEEHRSLIWRFLLQTPGNREAFKGLTDRGTHPNFAYIFKDMKNMSHNDYDKTEKVCSALAYWSPFFGEIDYLPKLVHPFGKVYPGDDLSCFEVVASVIVHWLQHWFEFFPNAPVVCLQSIDNILMANSQQMYDFLLEKLGNLSVITWPLLKSWLFDVVPHGDWVKIVDFLFTDWDKPELTLYMIAMYILYYKKRIFALQKKKDVINFFNTKRPLKVKKFMKNVFNLYENAGTKTSVVAFNVKLPLTPIQYPLFTGYPKYVVESIDDIAEQIKIEEELKNKEKEYKEGLQKRLNNIEEQEDEFQQRTHAAINAEREKFQQLKIEEKERLEVMKQNDREAREKRLHQIERIEEEGKNYVDRQKSRRAALLEKLHGDIEFNKNRQDYYQQYLMEEEALNALEYRATQRLLGLLKAREAEESAKKAKIPDLFYDREVDLKDRLLQAKWALEEQERKISQAARENLQKEEKELEDNQKLLSKNAINRRVEELEREIKILDLEKERKLRHLAEDELHRNEEFNEDYQRHLKILKKKEEANLNELQQCEQENELRRAKERFEIIMQERENQLNERLKQQKAMLEIENENSQREAEEKLITIRKEQEQKSLMEEKKLQEEILKLEIERRAEKQLEQQILFKEKELREKNIFEKVLHDTEKRLSDSVDYVQPVAEGEKGYNDYLSKANQITQKRVNSEQGYSGHQSYSNSSSSGNKYSSMSSSYHSSYQSSQSSKQTPPLPVRMNPNYSSSSENSEESFNLSQSENSQGEYLTRHTAPAYSSEID
ncbi:unnamed protein product [Blepharisma stoltei]|uniref:WD repeat-containing protein 67 n=1 Tax=Blepharisma stoltei TaxID=1481888 RepID=A0AAU9K397_9CILI|nr:unnamed protein product [Blepharisma stoltei]